MHIHLIAVGNNMPLWVNQGFDEYSRRMPGSCIIQLTEVTPGKRGKGADIQRVLEREGERLLAAIPKGCLVIVTDVRGTQWSTEQLANKMEDWMQQGRDIAVLIGGPEGYSQNVRDRADVLWSLSMLTMPHSMVRVVLAEQLYRAHSIIMNHPYHRH